MDGMAKTNWDAAVDFNNQKIGIGIIVRDSNGEILACVSTSKSFSSQPILAECLALWQTIEFCDKLGLLTIQLEGDVQAIVNAVKVEEECQA